MKTFSIGISMKPVGKGRPRLGRKGVYTPSKTVAAEETIKWHLRKHDAPKFDGPLALHIVCAFVPPKSAKKRLWPHVKPDLDNIVKLIKDACNGILFEDDAQVCMLRAAKIYSDRELVTIEVFEL